MKISLRHYHGIDDFYVTCWNYGWYLGVYGIDHNINTVFWG